jgi:predicted MFS family arabinose efflux permease
MLADRFGARRIALWSIPLIALGFAGVGLTMNSLWMLYLGALIVGIAGSGSATYTRAISGWFDSGRGVALGIAFSGIGLTAIAGPRITQMVVDSMGWRIGFVFMGGMTLVPLPAVYFWLYERRESAGRQSAAPEPGYLMLEVLRLPAFWLIGGGGLLYFLCYTGVQFNLIPYLTDSGMSRASAANYAGALGAFVLIGKLIAGAILDRWRAPIVLSLVLMVDALAIASLVLFKERDLVLCLGAIGFAHGSVMNGVPYCVSRFFGMRFFASISGMISILLGLSALGPLLFSVLRDVSGSYSASLFVSSGLVLGAAALFATLGFQSYYPILVPDPGKNSD